MLTCVLVLFWTDRSFSVGRIEQEPSDSDSNSEHRCLCARSERACLHDRLGLEFFIDWGEQQGMMIRVSRSCSLCFSTNIRAFKKKRKKAAADADQKASVPQELESAVRDQPDCGRSVTVCWVPHLPQGSHPPPSTAASVSAQSWLLTPDYEEMFGAGGTKKKTLLLWLLTTMIQNINMHFILFTER